MNVEIPLRGNDRLKFDQLNKGSCFCIYSAFHAEKRQKFDFRTNTKCVIETISAADIIQIEKE